MDQETDQTWQQLSEQILADIKEWRRSHPKATLGEIEEEVAMRMSCLEAQVIPRHCPRKPEPRVGGNPARRTANVPGVWNATASTGATDAPITSERRARNQFDPQLWHLSQVRDRTFSPSMRN